MAGLLDSLFSPASGSGLLDFLRNNATSQQPLMPLASDQAQYNAPSQNYNFAPSLAPQQTIPQNQPPVIQAQSTPIIPQQPVPAAQSPGVGDRLLAGLQGFVAAPQEGGLLGKIVGGIGGLAGQDTPSNLTARALIAKGVDPQVAKAAVGNPDLMKTLIAQTYGPHNIQSIGNGYVYDPRTNKVTRAYTPDDKIPQGFTQDDSGNLHFTPGGPADPAYMRQKQAATATVPVGFQQTKDGLQPIPGGPADPNYLRMKAQQGTDPNATHVLGKGGEIYKNNPDGTINVIHKNEDGAEATLSDDAVKAMASQYLSGDRTVLQNLGRGAQGAANIVKLREEITKQAHDAGMSAKDIVTTFNEQAGNLAGQRTVGTRAANISLAANEANNMIPIALEASDKVPRSQWMPWNKMVQAYQTGSSSPELASFVAATNSLVNAYVRAVSPSGVPTDSMREHAYSMLNSAQGPEAFKAVVTTMQKEMQSALAAPGQVRKELRGEGGASPDAPNSKVKVIDGYKIMEH